MAPRTPKRQLPKPTVATIENWYIQRVPDGDSDDRGPLRVFGMPVGGPPNLWRSSSIVRRLSSTTLETRYRTTVILKGPIDADAAKEISMTPEAANTFKDGFPLAWRTLATTAFTEVPRATRDTMGEMPIPTHPAPAAPPASSGNVNGKKRTSNATKLKKNGNTKKNKSKARISTSRKRTRNPQTVLRTIPIENFLPNSKRSRRATEPPPRSYLKPPPPEMTRKSTGNASSRPPRPPSRSTNVPIEEFDDVHVMKKARGIQRKRKSKGNSSKKNPPIDDDTVGIDIESPRDPSPIVIGSDDDDFVTPLRDHRNTESMNAKSKRDDDDDEYHTPPMEQDPNPIPTKSPTKKPPRRSPKKASAAEKKKAPVRGESTDTDANLRDAAGRLRMLMNEQHSKTNTQQMQLQTPPRPQAHEELCDEDVETEADEPVSDANEIPRSALAARKSILREIEPLEFYGFGDKSPVRPSKENNSASVDRVPTAEEALPVLENDPVEMSDVSPKADNAKQALFDKLLKTREEQVKKNEMPAFPEPVKRQVIQVDSFYTSLMPTPIQPKKKRSSKSKSVKRTSAPAPATSKSKSTKRNSAPVPAESKKKKKNSKRNSAPVPAEAKKKNAKRNSAPAPPPAVSKKNSKKPVVVPKNKKAPSNTVKAKQASSAAAATVKKTTQPKKRAVESGAGPSKNASTKRRKISFKDQLTEIEDEPKKHRGGRRASRMAQASSSANTPARDSGAATRGVFWTKEQIDAYNRMRREIPTGTKDLWKKVAAGVEGRSEQECLERWWDSMETPEKKKKDKPTTKKKVGGKSTPELALNYAQHGVTKAHTKTAKFVSNMRRIVDANARDVVASQEQVYEPPRVAGYSPTTPVGMFPSDSSSVATPGTEARERRKEMEPPKFDTPEPFTRNGNNGAAGNCVADRIVAQFKKRFGSVLNATGTDGAAAPAVEKKKANGPEMEDVLREMNRKKGDEDKDGTNSESGDEEGRESEEEGEDALI